MNVLKISLQNLKLKPLYTLLSVFILALSIALLLGVQQLKSSFQHQMDNNLGGIDLVIGAKGSPLQLVLSSVLHIDNPTGNIPYKEAQNIGKNPLVKSAVPISYGDNYKGFRIVGTTPEFLSFYDAELEKGRSVQKSMEVVLGSTIAKATNLKIGDTFKSSHGLIENTIDVHNEVLTVVGVLKPTQKVIDRLLVANLETVWDAHHHQEETSDEHEHEHEGEHEEDHEHEYDDKEVTSLLLKFKSPRALLMLPRTINKNTNLQAVIPKYELNRLYEFTGVGFKTISLIAYLILIISGLTIFISLYKMVKERAFDLALLRTYGATNFQLIKMISYEGVIIGILACVTGFLVVKLGIHLLLNFSGSSYQQNILQQLSLQDILPIFGLVFGMIMLAVLFAIYPIVKMNISTILSNEK